MKGTHFRSPMHAPTFRVKGSSSDEIILHNVSKINGSERTLEKTIHAAHLHCLHGIKLWNLQHRCHGFVVHTLLLRMNKNVVDFRVMRRLCHRQLNWQAKLTKREPHAWDPRQRTTWSRLVTSDFNSVFGNYFDSLFSDLLLWNLLFHYYTIIDEPLSLNFGTVDF